MDETRHEVEEGFGRVVHGCSIDVAAVDQNVADIVEFALDFCAATVVIEGAEDVDGNEGTYTWPVFAEVDHDKVVFVVSSCNHPV